MGFSFKKIGKFIDSLDEVTDGLYKEVSKDVKKKARSAGQMIDSAFDVAGDMIDSAFDVAGDMYNETSKKVDKRMRRVSKDVNKKAKSAGQMIDFASDVAGDLYNETSKKVNKGMKRVGKFVDDNCEYVETAGALADYAFDSAANAIGKVKSFVINVAKQLVDILFIREQVKKRNPNALRAQILAKKKNAVDVGIFSDDKMTEKMTINSDMGVSNDIYRGQMIDIYA